MTSRPPHQGRCAGRGVVRRAAMLAAVVSGLLAAAASVPAVAAGPDALETYLETVRVSHGLPAVAAAAVKDGEVVAIGATGVRALGREETVTREDRFHLGSNTKAMTATIAGALVDEGLIGWDSTLGEVLGGTIEGMNDGLAAVTLGELLSHASGLPGDNAAIIQIYGMTAFHDGNPDAQRLEALRLWKDEVPKVPEGSPFQYSNLNYILAGAMLEHVAGKPWEELIAERIFDPLGLSSAGLGPQVTFGRYDAPAGHAVDEEGNASPRFWGTAADNPPMIGPAGTAHMSVADFATWAGWNAGGARRGPALVSPETLATIHAPHVKTPVIADPAPGTPVTGGYGYGWGSVAYDFTDGPVLSHNGSNNMNLAAIIADRQDDFAVVMLTNHPGPAAREALSEIGGHLWTTYGGGS